MNSVLTRIKKDTIRRCKMLQSPVDGKSGINNPTAPKHIKKFNIVHSKPSTIINGRKVILELVPDHLIEMLEEPQEYHDCEVCTSGKGWWCHVCDIMVHMYKLKNELELSEEEEKKIRLRIVTTEHPVKCQDLIPCFLCNRFGENDTSYQMQKHISSIKHVDFWNDFSLY